PHHGVEDENAQHVAVTFALELALQRRERPFPFRSRDADEREADVERGGFLGDGPGQALERRVVANPAERPEDAATNASARLIRLAGYSRAHTRNAAADLAERHRGGSANAPEAIPAQRPEERCDHALVSTAR